MTVRSTIGMFALSAIAALGCNDLVRPTGPAPVDPPTQAVVTISVFGTRPDPDGYDVVLRTEDGDEIASRRVGTRGGTPLFPDLARGTYSVGVAFGADNCSVEGDNPRSFTVRERTTSRIDFVLSCRGPDVAGVYWHASPERSTERYVLDEDGTFLLDHESDAYSGTYALPDTDSEIVFDFDAFSAAGDWRATGTLEGTCMTVEYDLVMSLSDFVDGGYCR